jgi:predicted secreted protein
MRQPRWMMSLMLACGLGGIASAAPMEVAHLAPGELFTVSMEANPSTGYGWSVEVPPGGPVSLISQDMRQQEQAAGRVGAPEVQTFCFKAGTASQKARLRFVYRRPWEKSQPPASTFEVAVEIGKPHPGGSHSSSFHLVALHHQVLVGLPYTSREGSAWTVTPHDPKAAIVKLVAQREPVQWGAPAEAIPETWLYFEGVREGHASLLATAPQHGKIPAASHYIGITVIKGAP